MILGGDTDEEERQRNSETWATGFASQGWPERSVSLLLKAGHQGGLWPVPFAEIMRNQHRMSS